MCLFAFRMFKFENHTMDSDKIQYEGYVTGGNHYDTNVTDLWGRSNTSPTSEIQ
jgi:hypothetical protein